MRCGAESIDIVRGALRYAIHDSLVTAAFSGLFLLKVANLFPSEVDLAGITVQVEQLAQLLTDVAAERYVSPLTFPEFIDLLIFDCDVELDCWHKVCLDASPDDRQPPT